MNRYKLAIASICAIALSGMGIANAALVTYNIKGDIYDDWGTGIFVGQSYSVNISWETTTQNSTTEGAGGASFNGAWKGLVGTVGLRSITNAENIAAYSGIRLANGDSWRGETDLVIFDYFRPYTPSFESYLGEYIIDYAGLVFVDSSGSVLSDYSLISGLSLADFDTDLGTSKLSMGILDGPFISGTITSISEISAVPVPTAVWLFGSGLISLIGIARRKAYHC